MRLLLAALLAMSAFAATATAGHGRVAAQSLPIDYLDATGDNGAAPDLAKLSISNDDQGEYTFLARFATPYGPTATFSIYLDTDNNGTTGDTQALGADYLLFDYNAQHALSFLKWNGTAWGDAPSNATVSAQIAADGSSLTVSVNKSELGNAGSFNFFVAATDGTFSDGHIDEGPGTGGWSYSLLSTFTLSVSAAKAAAAVAGGQWTLALAAKRSDTGKTVGSEGSITCNATAGSKKLKLVSRAFVSSGGGGANVAACVFAVPKTLKHKIVHGTISVSLQGQAVTRTFAATVK